MSQSDEHVTVRATSRCKLNGCDSTGLNWVVIVQKCLRMMVVQIKQALSNWTTNYRRTVSIKKQKFSLGPCQFDGPWQLKYNQTSAFHNNAVMDFMFLCGLVEEELGSQHEQHFPVWLNQQREEHRLQKLTPQQDIKGDRKRTSLCH